MVDPHSASDFAPATRALLEHLPVGTYELRIRPDGNPEFTHVSTRWLEMCGFTRAQFMADQALAIEVIHPDDRQNMIAANLESLAKTQPFHWEGRLIVHGEVVWVAISSNPREDEGGEILWEGVMIDISAYKRLESQLREHLNQLRVFLEHLPTAVLVLALTQDQPAIFSNAAFERVFGYTQLEMRGIRDWARLVCRDPEDHAATWAWWQDALAKAITSKGRVAPKALRISHKDGSERHVVMSAALVDNLLITSFEDITGQKHIEEELRLSEQKFRTFVEQANDIIYTLNPDGEFQYLSPNLREILGHDPADFLGQYIASIVHPDDLQSCQDFLLRLIKTRKKQSGLEYRVRHQNGEWRWHVTNASPLLDPAGKLIGMLGIAHDISERKANEAQITHLAHYDGLTDLLNRTLLFDRVQQALRDAERNQFQVGLMFVDLDSFKPINDTHGHAVGDQVLRGVAVRLLQSVRKSDSVGRVGGDEFLILLPRITNSESALKLGNKIIRALREPFHVGDLNLEIACSIGIALFPEHGRDPITLERRADQAMYQAKQRGGAMARLAEPKPAVEDPTLPG